MTRVTIDFETRSEVDIQKCGAWVYSESETTEPICLCYKIDSGAIGRWTPFPSDRGHLQGDPHLAAPMPDLLRRAVLAGAEVEAHNMQFEIGIWANVMVARYGWSPVPLAAWRDSMAAACYLSLPAKLDKLAMVLGFGRKDPEGSRLISKYSKLYNKTAKPQIPDDDLRKFVDYCVKDVELEHAISNFLGDLPEREHLPFTIDMEMNLRGLKLDLEGIAAASAVVEQRRDELRLAFRRITSPTGDPADGLNPTQRDKVMDWLAANGVVVPDMKAETLEDLLEEDGDDAIPSQSPARKALQIRLKINKASTDKLAAMAANTSRNGRALWQSRYHGAGTGRSTGSGFQPLNLNRGFEKVNEELLVGDIMLRDPEWLDVLYGDAMDAVSKASRHWIQAEEGNRILAGDFSSIEAKVIALLAGETWKIDAFHADKAIYALMGCKIHKLDEALADNGDDWFKEHFKAERQDGKTGELAFGFQGALGAWLKFDSSGRHTDERIIEICKAWRAEHPMVVKAWQGVGDAAIEAVEHPGRTTGYREIGFETVDEWLSMILPDGKRLWYWKPKLTLKMPKWHQPDKKEECAAGECKCRPMTVLSYETTKTGQWKRIDTYGGHQFQNAVQATARQILEPAKARVRAAGYPIILSVYDEVVAEPPIGFGSLEHYLDLLKGPLPKFAEGWPIGVDGFESNRYKK